MRVESSKIEILPAARGLGSPGIIPGGGALVMGSPGGMFMNPGGGTLMVGGGPLPPIAADPVTSQKIKMASLFAVQTLFSTPKNFLVDPLSMAYGKSRNAKKIDLGLFILELLAKIKKMEKIDIFSLIF